MPLEPVVLEGKHIQIKEKLEDENQKLKLEINEMKMKYEEAMRKNLQHEMNMHKRLTTKSFSKADLENKDDKVHFYTGLTNWEILLKLYKFLEQQLSELNHTSLDPFQQLMLALTRLRLGGSGVELGYQFKIHPSTVSCIFSDDTELLYVRLKFLIVWPERDVLRKTLPLQFRKNYPNCVAIIDCFEIFIDRPNDLLARSITYSSYKHHNTVKYLIAISPKGTVSFISEGWGGRASDKHITENSNFFNYLLPGDTILADRGFDLKASLGLFAATIKIPAFTRGKKQLEAIEVEQTRSIANVRIYVERVIGNIRKKYLILSCTQPIDYLILKRRPPQLK